MAVEARVISAGTLLAGYSDTGEAIFVENSALLVSDGRIADMGPTEELLNRYRNAVVERYPGHIMTPGFVDAHHHVGMTPLQMGSLDYPLELWVGSGAARRGLDPRLDTLFAAAEMLKSGITTVQHIQGSVGGPAENMLSIATKVIGAYEEIGMRASYCFNARDQNRIVHQDDEAFVSTLPADLKQLVAQYVKKRTVSRQDYLDLFDQLRRDWQHKDRVAIQLAPANLHWCSDEMLDLLWQKAVAADVPLHMHLVETKYQQEYARRRTGTTAVKHLQRLGMLGPRMTLGHGVWVSEEDIDILAQSGTCICHNCSSNMRLGSGKAPVNDYLQRGMTVALGIDEAGINDDRDMLQEMRLVLYQHREPGHKGRWPSASNVLRMATEHGAATTAFGMTIGTLKIGAHADFLLFDKAVLTRPFQDPEVPLI
ncbi:amidohydrolase, partial [Mesorhizobium sp. M7D.F.Ca.US.004.03.1.1]|uniref:amidohydrolase family protein n=1 Tax=Mesorhizobium sp. M7D.F.Ca.US.004.03.1.1 TaxID=2496702 RepID=UPI000FCB836A